MPHRAVRSLGYNTSIPHLDAACDSSGERAVVEPMGCGCGKPSRHAARNVHPEKVAGWPAVRRLLRYLESVAEKQFGLVCAFLISSNESEIAIFSMFVSVTF